MANSIIGTAAYQGRSHRTRHKIARMVWAIMTKGERYKEPVALAA
jgi:hypothetical protein